MNTSVMRVINLGHRAGSRGNAAVEFAFVLVLLVMIIGAIIEFGRLFWYYDALTKATRDGARLMSVADKSKISSDAVPAAKTSVIVAARDAHVRPAVTAGDVVVQCLDDNFRDVGCVDGTAPTNVRVEINGFKMVIGEWFPLLLPAGGVMASTGYMSLHTTMPYMP